MGVGPMEQEEVTASAVGRRVACDGERATVRYVGPIPPTAGLWLGVEWDHPSRGKHDGSHDGVQYFTCRHQHGGSFVRPAKVSFGVDYVTAVRQEYKTNADFPSEANSTIEWRIKERSFEDLSSVLLGQSGVNGPGQKGAVRKLTPNVTWLDMSKSLLSCWDDVGAICLQLEKLQTLMLSYNRLSLPAEPAALHPAFHHLSVLSLVGCDLTWLQVLECAPMWPQLEELDLLNNNITELQRPDGVLQSLKSLTLSGNPLVHHTVNTLASLCRLETLDLSKTGLSNLQFEDTRPGCQTSMFPALTDLNLNNNNISQWCVVDELAKLPSLVKLHCFRNQLVSYDQNPSTTNQLIIARLEKLEFLNRTEVNLISPEIRRGAELDYIKMFGEEWLKAGGRSQISGEFILQHPRFLSLINKYGAPEEGELKKWKPPTLKNLLIKITFVFPDNMEREPIKKQLPVTMEVRMVKVLLHRLLKVPLHDLRLTYISSKVSGTEFHLDRDMKTLHFYSVEDGDQVVVRWP
ncbi:tubulin-specific chaperone E isoform X3 [Takifugu flavidus]|uniref:tubulin-specific chaperone E isoform X3 n=1 Tax=Takifugu flavidus TaxID=433684 RepID=UPI002544985E|nr:tubulin-specific chaperone E isoform X3 [Takifugu flavidus]